MYVVPMNELGKTIPTIPNTLNHLKQVFRNRTTYCWFL